MWVIKQEAEKGTGVWRGGEESPRRPGVGHMHIWGIGIQHKLGEARKRGCGAYIHIRGWRKKALHASECVNIGRKEAEEGGCHLSVCKYRETGGKALW